MLNGFKHFQQLIHRIPIACGRNYIHAFFNPFVIEFGFGW
jgi:hypothetical protein